MMDQAHIRTTIPIHTSVPAKFDLPLNTVTTVVLQRTYCSRTPSWSALKTGGTHHHQRPGRNQPAGRHRAACQPEPGGPVDQQIPVNLTVTVDIPLSQTDLHTPFVGLQNVVSPYQGLLDSTPNSLQEAVCGPAPSDFCKWMIP